MRACKPRVRELARKRWVRELARVHVCLFFVCVFLFLLLWCDGFRFFVRFVNVFL